MMDPRFSVGIALKQRVRRREKQRSGLEKMKRPHQVPIADPIVNARGTAALPKASAGDPGTNAPSPLILFDGVCNLCNWSVQFLAPRDRRKLLWFAPMQSASGQAVLAGRSIPKADWESFVLVEDGHAYFKSEAFFRTLRFMTYPWPLLRVGAILPRRLADWLYDRVARNRYAVFGKKSACMIPSPDLAARFLP